MSSNLSLAAVEFCYSQQMEDAAMAEFHRRYPQHAPGGRQTWHKVCCKRCGQAVLAAPGRDEAYCPPCEPQEDDFESLARQQGESEEAWFDRMQYHQDQGLMRFHSMLNRYGPDGGCISLSGGEQ